MPAADHARSQKPALVSRATVGRDEPEQYLVLSSAGPLWTTDPAEATAFESMREAMRAAVRLPSGLHAFGLPLRSELLTRQELH